ncbi:MAG: glycosyltransferase family 39 protein [Anaerolineae bacterium]|nr:glycosyltransferase family 39 protein [Anaerolineae bacterium]
MANPKSIWPLLAIVGGGFALRLIALGQRAMWYDEAFAVLYAEKPFATMLYGTVTQVGGAAADVHPLFFYTLLHGWMEAVGQSPIAVRMLPVLLGTATVAMIYLLARRLFGHQVGLVAAAIAAIAPFQIYYSQEARMYALLGLSTATMTYFFARAWTGNRWLDWLAFGFFGAVTLYAHNLGIMFVAGLDLWIAWMWLTQAPHVSGGQEAWRWRRLREVILSHLLMIGLFAPWLAIVPSQLGKIQQAYWVEQPGIAQLVQTLIVLHFAYDNEALPGWLLPLALLISVLILAVVLFELVRQGRNPARGCERGEWTRNHKLCLLACLTFVPILLTFAASQVRPVYIIRALLPSGLAYYLLAASLLTARSVPKAIKWGLLAPSVLIIAVSLANHYAYAQFPRPPFDRAAAYLRDQHTPGSAIVHSNKLSFLPTHYYDRSLPQAFIADEPLSPSDTLAYPTQQALGLFATPDLATATQGMDRVWFVVFQRAIEEYQDAGYTTHPHLTWLDQHYTLVQITPFNDLDIYEYQAVPSSPK